MVSQCNKKKFEEWLKTQPKSGSNVSQNSQPNNSNFKYNLGYSNLQCTHCGKNGHSVDTCRFRLNAMAAAAKAADGLVFDKVNSSGQRSGQNIMCNYCKKLGHMKTSCHKLAYNNAKKAQLNANVGAPVQQRPSAYIKKCYICDDGHLARNCPRKNF